MAGRLHSGRSWSSLSNRKFRCSCVMVKTSSTFSRTANRTSTPRCVPQRCPLGEHLDHHLIEQEHSPQVNQHSFPHPRRLIAGVAQSRANRVVQARRPRGSDLPRDHEPFGSLMHTQKHRRGSPGKNGRSGCAASPSGHAPSVYRDCTGGCASACKRWTRCRSKMPRCKPPPPGSPEESPFVMCQEGTHGAYGESPVATAEGLDAGGGRTSMNDVDLKQPLPPSASTSYCRNRP